MVNRLEQLANEYIDRGFTAEGNLLRNQAQLFRKAGMPNEFDSEQDLQRGIDNRGVSPYFTIQIDGTKVRELRLNPERPLSQTKVASLTRTEELKPLSRGYISQIESSSDFRIGIDSATRIATALGVELSQIVSEKKSE